MLFTIATLFVFFLGFSVHELGHAFAMRECNVQVKAISLLGVKGLGTIRLPLKFEKFPGTEWRFHPLIIAAYVEAADEDDLGKLSWRDHLYVCGMGPLANILFLLVVVILFVVVNLLLVAIGSDFAAIPGKISFRTPFVLAAYVALPVLVWLFRRRICEFALLPVGFLMLALLAVWNFKFFQFHGMPFYGGSDFVGDIYAKAPKDVSMYASLWRGAITGMFLSTLMGVCNLIPLMPADGGHMMKSLLPHAWRNTFSYATVPVVALLLLFQYGKDLYNLGHWLYSIF